MAEKVNMPSQKKEKKKKRKKKITVKGKLY